MSGSGIGPGRDCMERVESRESCGGRRGSGSRMGLSGDLRKRKYESQKCVGVQGEVGPPPGGWVGGEKRREGSSHSHRIEIYKHTLRDILVDTFSRDMITWTMNYQSFKCLHKIEQEHSSNRLLAYTGENFISPTASKFCPRHNPTTICKGTDHGLTPKLNIYTKI